MLQPPAVAACSPRAHGRALARRCDSPARRDSPSPHPPTSKMRSACSTDCDAMALLSGPVLQLASLGRKTAAARRVDSCADGEAARGSSSRARVGRRTRSPCPLPNHIPPPPLLALSADPLPTPSSARMPLVEGLPAPYSAIPPRRRKAQPMPPTAATAARRSPPAPVASTSRLPTTADELRRAFRPSRVGRGASRCPAECCERPLLFAEDDDGVASGSASSSSAAAWSTRSTTAGRRPAASQPWSTLLASLTTSPSSSSSNLGSPPLLSGSAGSSASSLLLTPPDELASFAFAKAAAPAASASGRSPRQIGRRTGDSLVEELEGGFEWALGRALGSLKGSLAMGLPIRGSRRRSRAHAASAGKTTLAAGGGGTNSAATPEIGTAPDLSTGGRPQRRTRSPSSTRLPVQPGSCPLTRPRSPSPIRTAAPSPKSPPARAIMTPATSPPRSLGLAHLFAGRPPPVVLLWPSSGVVSSSPANPRSPPPPAMLPCEAYLSSLPLLPMSRPPTPAQVLRPHFPVLRPRALERYVVFGHMRRAGKIGQQGAGGDVEWRRVRERQRARAEGSALRWEL